MRSVFRGAGRRGGGDRVAGAAGQRPAGRPTRCSYRLRRRREARGADPSWRVGRTRGLSGDREAQKRAFLAAAGLGEATRTPLTGDASTRRYERLTTPSGTSLIFMDQPP